MDKKLPKEVEKSEKNPEDSFSDAVAVRVTIAKEDSIFKRKRIQPRIMEYKRICFCFILGSFTFV